MYEGCRNYIYLQQGSVYLKDCSARVYIVLKENVMDRPYENTFMFFFMVIQNETNHHHDSGRRSLLTGGLLGVFSLQDSMAG